MSEQVMTTAAQENGAASSRSQGPARDEPARGYSWAPFAPGHRVTMVHGGNSDREIAPRAEEFATGLLEDATMPAHVRSPAFAAAVHAWARAEAIASLMYDWICGLDIDALTTPRKVATRAPVELWRSAEQHAANLRTKLGLDPVAYAKIAKDLGVAQRANEDALNRLGETGRQIRESRAAGDADAVAS